MKSLISEKLRYKIASLKSDIKKSDKSNKIVVFLGGECSEGNAWRKDIKKEFKDDIFFLDPYDKNWEPENNIYDELTGITKADHVIFYNPGKGSKKEMNFLDQIGADDSYEIFDDLDTLKNYLRNLSKPTKIKESSSLHEWRKILEKQRVTTMEDPKDLRRSKFSNNISNSIRKVAFDMISKHTVGKSAKVGVQYNYSSTQVDLPDDLAEKIISWGKKNILDTDIYEDPEDPSMGRENEIHVTVLYGIKRATIRELKDLLKVFSPFKVRLGLITAFKDKDTHDVIKVDAEAPELQKMHYFLEEKLDNKNSFPTYSPHITIAYVKKDAANKYIGSDAFKGKEFTVDQIMYSTQNGDKIPVKLTGK